MASPLPPSISHLPIIDHDIQGLANPSGNIRVGRVSWFFIQNSKLRINLRAADPSSHTILLLYTSPVQLTTTEKLGQHPFQAVRSATLYAVRARKLDLEEPPASATHHAQTCPCHKLQNLRLSGCLAAPFFSHCIYRISLPVSTASFQKGSFWPIFAGLPDFDLGKQVWSSSIFSHSK